jgi:hydrogenase maturation factor
MRVLRLDRTRSLALCVGLDHVAGSEQEVAIDLVEPVAVEDLLLVHAGVALANLGDASNLAGASPFAGGGGR